MIPNETLYRKIITIEELGKHARRHRKSRGMTLESAAGIANVSVRFFSEFERGKETAEIGKVLTALHALGLDIIIASKEDVDYRADNEKTEKGIAKRDR